LSLLGLRINKIKIALLAILTGLVGATFALSPQIGYWRDNGWSSQSIYAINDNDEVAYAAYVQSLIEGRPRRNSPYSGNGDGESGNLGESIFSVQVLASYPVALLGRALGLSSSTAFIIFSAFYGFLAGLSVFYLFFVIFHKPFLSFTGAIIVIAAGALAAGQGSIMRSLVPDSIYYGIAFPFARRLVPLAGFPLLFLFFASVWQYLSTLTIKRYAWLAASCVMFAGLVFTYFYLWTTAVAWVFGLGLLIVLIRPERFKSQLFSLAKLGAAMIVVLAPYFLLLRNRSGSTDSIQLLEFSRNPDLFRISEILSLGIIIVYLSLALLRKTRLREFRTLFLLSFALVPFIVFNQQILSGISLQPLHYQFYAANYTLLFALMGLFFLILSGEKFKFENALILLVAALGLFIGTRELLEQRTLDGLRKDIAPVAEHLQKVATPSDMVLAFDLTRFGFSVSDELPALSSTPVLWAPHQNVFGDLTPQQSLERFFCFVYLQDKDEYWLRKQIDDGYPLVEQGLWGWERKEELSSAGQLTKSDADSKIDSFRNFAQRFDRIEAEKYPISYVLVHKFSNPSFTNIDKYYRREIVWNSAFYELYATRLRD